MNGFQALYAFFVGIWICALVALAGCTQSTVTVNGDNDAVTVMMSPVNTLTATIPASAIPGLPGGVTTMAGVR